MGIATIYLLGDGAIEHADHVQDLMVAVATIVISSFVAWVTAKRAIRGDERRALRDGNIRLLEWAIEYPFLESEKYCSLWPSPIRSEEDNMRYVNYCCHVFNVLQQSWEFCGGNEQEMQHILYPDELIWMHRRWWKSDETNQKAYPVGFRQFVATKLRLLEKENVS